MSAERHLALALIRAGATPTTLRLPWGSPLRVHPVGDVALVHADAPTDPLDRQVAAAVHDAVCALARHTTVLPLRLGPAAPLDMLVDALSERGHAAARALDHLVGRVELDTRWPLRLDDVLPSRAVSGGPGAAFLASRREAHAGPLAAERATERVDAFLDGLPDVVAIDRPAPRTVEATRAVLGRALLVPRPLADALAATLRRDAPGPVRVTGPWPAWSFATWAFDRARGDGQGGPAHSVSGLTLDNSAGDRPAEEIRGRQGGIPSGPVEVSSAGRRTGVEPRPQHQ